jgi:hypothetical protein
MGNVSQSELSYIPILLDPYKVGSKGYQNQLCWSERPIGHSSPLYSSKASYRQVIVKSPIEDFKLIF